MTINVNKKIYISDYAKKHKRKYLRNIEHRKFQFDVFVIALSEDEHEQLEIYPSYLLLQPYYDEKTVDIVGLATTKEEAIDLVQFMLEDTMKRFGHYDIRELFK